MAWNFPNLEILQNSLKLLACEQSVSFADGTVLFGTEIDMYASETIWQWESGSHMKLGQVGVCKTPRCIPKNTWLPEEDK